MRTINVPVEVIENVTVERTAVKEQIAEYTVNKKAEYIQVRIELIASDGTVVGYEDYYFDNSDYQEDIVEFDLWSLVDKKRGT